MADEKLEYGLPGPCPCGKSDKFCPIKNAGMNGGGKCQSTKCGQRFFPPERTIGQPPPQRGSQFREHTYEDENDFPLVKVTIWKSPSGEKRTSISHWAGYVGEVDPLSSVQSDSLKCCQGVHAFAARRLKKSSL